MFAGLNCVLRIAPDGGGGQNSALVRGGNLLSAKVQISNSHMFGLLLLIPVQSIRVRLDLRITKALTYGTSVLKWSLRMVEIRDG